MLYLIAYDISDNRRRYRIDRALKGYGKRVQKSLFECYLDDAQRKQLENRLAKLLDKENDNIRIYALCPKDNRRVIVQGTGTPPRDTDYLLF